MTIDDFDKLFTEMCAAERELLYTKGAEYSGKEDRLLNFKRLAKDLNLDPKQILWVYLSKHMDAIRSYVATNETHSTEPIEGRIHDARNYLALLFGLIKQTA